MDVWEELNKEDKDDVKLEVDYASARQMSTLDRVREEKKIPYPKFLTLLSEVLKREIRINSRLTSWECELATRAIRSQPQHRKDGRPQAHPQVPQAVLSTTPHPQPSKPLKRPVYGEW